MPEMSFVAAADDDSESKSFTRLSYGSYISKFKKQFFACAVACIGALSTGAIGGYTSPTMDALRRRFSLSEQEESIFVSLLTLGAIPGGLLSGALADYCGRKLALMLNCAVFAIGWFLILCAQNVYMLYAARLIGGFATAMAALCVPVYIAEISSPEIRGALGIGFQLSMCGGILFSYGLGAVLSWPYLALAGLGLPALQIMLMLLLPETPIWLKRHNYHEAAASSVAWLNLSDDNNDEHKLDEKQQVTNKDKFSMKSFTEPELLKPLAILCTQMFIQQFSGVGVILLYAVDIFKSSSSALPPNTSAIIVASSMLVAICVASVLVDKLGRKVLLIVSSTFMSIGLIAFGTFYYMQETNSSAVAELTWLPIVCLVTYEFSYGIGYGPVPWVMMGEVFSNKARGLASGCVTTFSWTMAFVMSKTFVDLRNIMHSHGVFWMFGAVSVFAAFFAYFFVPETKGKSLDEIELYFKKSNKDEE